MNASTYVCMYKHFAYWRLCTTYVTHTHAHNSHRRHENKWQRCAAPPNFCRRYWRARGSLKHPWFGSKALRTIYNAVNRILSVPSTLHWQLQGGRGHYFIIQLPWKREHTLLGFSKSISTTCFQCTPLCSQVKVWIITTLHIWREFTGCDEEACSSIGRQGTRVCKHEYIRKELSELIGCTLLLYEG